MPDTPAPTHGAMITVIGDEEFVGNDLLFEGDEPVPGPGEDPPDMGRVFKFCRMFPDLDKFRPDKDGLIALGFAMEKDDQGEDHPNLPAGFTYLGQFVDHDITRDNTDGIPDGELNDNQIIQGRSPTLDLDSVYLDGPDGAPAGMYADDRHLVVGSTTGVGFGGGSTSDVFPNDLPRQAPSGDPETGRKAIIGDNRNDENLAVAQTHLAFIKFHNKVVDKLGLDFESARDVVTQHYQSIVLHDFVPRIVDPMIYDDVVHGDGPQFFVVADGEFPCMPVEFSVAAYRLGHSMIRDFYHWNRVFRTEGPGPEGTLELLFDFSRGSGNLAGHDTLASNWIVDWRRMFELPGFDPPSFSNLAQLLDTKLAGPLMLLPEFSGMPTELRSLASRNLLRGRLIGLPTGQDVARAIGVPVLTKMRLRDSLHGELLEQHDFLENTPLWYYILREAEVQHGGRTLGAVGSRIVIETFFGLIKGSRTSILKTSDWTPDARLQPSSSDHYTMVDLLTFVDDINPLGN